MKRIRHPVARLPTLPYETLTIPGSPDRTLVAYTPQPGSETAEKMCAGTAAPPLPGGGTTAVPAKDAGRVRAGLARPWRPWRSGSRSGGP
ncbi:hypothetical protein AQI95_12455 [Streptomyces yokosukanensis]|uniref:MmyB-like transcription regulator ligand binding domain-containing protein n=1 Tax=Streptomyces yokosukanensis TaxID=67386 RepID=A0A101P853_9ACTN|nr:hypothetical protein AQI95_12455 [Streptomyces yokosukanensis]